MWQKIKGALGKFGALAWALFLIALVWLFAIHFHEFKEGIIMTVFILLIAHEMGGMTALGSPPWTGRHKPQ